MAVAWLRWLFLHAGLWQFYATCRVIGNCGEWCGGIWLLRVRFPPGFRSDWDGARLRDAGGRVGRDGLPVIAQANRYAIGLESGLSFRWRHCAAAGLPLSWRYIRERGPVREQSAPVAQFRIYLAARDALLRVLDHCRGALCGVDQHERSVTHLAALLTDRGITPGEAALCASILGGTSVLANRGGIAARPVFRRRVRLW